MASGLYIVTLNNDEAISVNANDPRIADRCIRVNRSHCKFGKARNLLARRRNYEKVFGSHNINFFPIVELSDIAAAEKLVLAKLHEWRIAGATGRRNEWLHTITPADVERIVIAALVEANVAFTRVGSVVAASGG